MPIFIKTGFWEKAEFGLKKWLNLDEYIKANATITDNITNITNNQADISSLEDRVDILEAIRWDDLRSPASGINPAGQVSPPTVNANDGSLSFSVNDAVCVWFQMPHGWIEGTEVHPHIHWSKSTSAAGTVNWQMKYKWFNIGDIAPAFSSLTSGTEPIPNSDTANKHSLLAFPPIDSTGKLISSMICVYLIRTATGDTYGAEVNLYEVDIHYQVDNLGTVNEFHT